MVKFFIGERGVRSVQGWNRIEVATVAAEEAVYFLTLESFERLVSMFSDLLA